MGPNQGFVPVLIVPTVSPYATAWESQTQRTAHSAGMVMPFARRSAGVSRTTATCWPVSATPVERQLAFRNRNDDPSPDGSRQRNCIHCPRPARHRRPNTITTLSAFEISPRARDPPVVISPLEFVASAALASLDDLRGHRERRLHIFAWTNKPKESAFATGKGGEGAGFAFGGSDPAKLRRLRPVLHYCRTATRLSTGLLGAPERWSCS